MTDTRTAPTDATRAGGAGPRVIVALIGHSTNSDNLGVGALTVAQVDILREIARRQGLDLTIRVIDFRDPRPAYIGGRDIEILRIRARDLLKPQVVFRALRGADLVLDIGAGDSFADIYTWQRLSQMLAAKYQTHLAGTPLVLSPQTMGPFRRAWARRAVLPHLRLCRGVFTRDALSTAFLKEDLGLKREVIEASDVALRLPHEAPPPREGGPVRVGLNVSGLLMGGGYTGRNQFGLKDDYPALIRGLIEDFRARDGVELHLVGHVISDTQPREDDHRACASLAEAYPGCRLAPRFADPSEAKSYIAGMDFFMGARMHATIAAFSTGVPVVPMAYSRKFRGLFGTLGYDRVVDCTAEAGADIRAKIAAAYGARATLKDEVAAALKEGRRKLARYTDFLDGLLAEIAAQRDGRRR